MLTQLSSIAGTHTTSATTSLLFHHLLHSPHVLEACVSEIDKSLPPLVEGKTAYSVADVESSLPYLRQCVRENFRITPVFTMPLARRIQAPQGLLVGGQLIPRGVCKMLVKHQVLHQRESEMTDKLQTSIAVCNHAFHHNPNVWGDDHMTFDPSRWDRPEINARARYLMHFGLGGRQCIGKTIAQTNIYKLSSTLLKKYRFELADSEEAAAAARGEYVGIIPVMNSVGISDLRDPLVVKAALRCPSSI
jgi:cytochrome P450